MNEAAALRLLVRVKKGQRLRSADRLAIRQAIAGGGAGADPYTLLHVLWENGDKADVDVFMSVLDATGHGEAAAPDEMLRRIALQALADLSAPEEVFELACHLLKHDTSGLVRIAAASAIGEIGAKAPTLKKRAAQALLSAIEGAAPGAITFDAVYDAMLSLLRVPLQVRPNAARPLRAADVQTEVLVALKRIAKGESDGDGRHPDR